MSASSAGGDDAGPGRSAPEDLPELVVVLVPGGGAERGVTAEDARSIAGTAGGVAPPEVLDVLGGAGPHARLRPLFGRARDAGAAASLAGEEGGPPAEYFLVEGIEGVEADGLEELAERLRDLDSVTGAYVKPPPSLPAVLNDMAPAAEEPPVRTPDYSDRQGYLGRPPSGIGARWAHLQPGGRGTGVNVIDVEGGWRFPHEDLLQRVGGIVGGTPTETSSWVEHGTAVIGVIGSDDNGIGTLGIAPEASVRTVSIFGAGYGTALAIRRAADALSPGDLLLLEVQRRGPEGAAFGQAGYLPIEWWPDDLAAISYAVARGVIVVEAAGNGSVDLDDDRYDTRPTGFPAGWRNPLGRGGPDSGAIMVGAGAPPPGTHGANWGPDRSRLDFSNYGSRVDVQGWGREVTTCGYGDLQGGSDEDLWYTDRFSGTSSASPIVVGVLACAQGILRAAGEPALTPRSARRFLRETGSPQQGSAEAPTEERIGSRPDIASFLARARGSGGGGKGGKEIDGDQPRKFPKLEKNEFKDAVDKVPSGRPAVPRPAMADRVAALEIEVERLRHFIGPDLRPDLTAVARATDGGSEEAGAPVSAEPAPTGADEPAPRPPSKRAAPKRSPAKRAAPRRSRGSAEER